MKEILGNDSKGETRGKRSVPFEKGEWLKEKKTADLRETGGTEEKEEVLLKI